MTERARESEAAAVGPGTETEPAGRWPSGDMDSDDRSRDDRSHYGRRYAEPKREQHAMSVTGLVRKLIEDVGRLFRKELAMATSEIVDSVEGVRSGVAGMIGGAAIFYGGVLCLLAAAVAGLAEVMEAWAATLIVGAAAAILGFIIMQIGKRRVSPRAHRPVRTEEALRRDRDMIKRQTS